ncbi:SWIB/MDM2 domain, partial [Dillenia turbinata]
MSLGIFSTVLPSDSTCLLKSSSSSASSLSFLSPPQTPGSPIRIISCNAASPKPASATGKRDLRGIMKPRRVSPEMQDLVGVPEIPRTQALKQIWAYIKEHNLQVFYVGLQRIVLLDYAVLGFGLREVLVAICSSDHNEWISKELKEGYPVFLLCRRKDGVVSILILLKMIDVTECWFSTRVQDGSLRKWDPENKKIIVCDEKLKKIFGGKDRVGFLEIAGLINPHFLKYQFPSTLRVVPELKLYEQ